LNSYEIRKVKVKVKGFQCINVIHYCGELGGGGLSLGSYNGGNDDNDDKDGNSDNNVNGGNSSDNRRL
jgi:hypothetical protein